MSDADGPGPQGLERAARQFRDQAEHDRRVRERQIAEFSRRQGWIAVAVLSLYLAVIGLAALAFIVSPFIGAASGAKLAQAAGALKDMANTLVLPIVTLVLGYYFGKQAG